MTGHRLASSARRCVAGQVLPKPAYRRPIQALIRSRAIAVLTHRVERRLAHDQRTADWPRARLIVASACGRCHMDVDDCVV
jgi:hypothetical protein